MLYYLLYPLHDIFLFLNVFRYITFRSAMAVVTAFLISILFGPRLIAWITRLEIGENVRKEDSAQLYELHKEKQGTPTMGGLLILLAVFTATILWADIFSKYILLVLFCTLWLGITGFVDDYLKHIRKCSKGLSPRAKFISQVGLALIAGAVLMAFFPGITRLDIPFLKNVSIDLGFFYILLVILVITGSSNAVNLTDGLDGLAIGIVIMVSLGFSLLAYISGNVNFTNYLFIPHIPGGGELAVFCSAVLGAGLGFLWFNCYPASIFMGDVGSLSLGGALGLIALMIKKELLLGIVGGVFVIEALSVIIQVASFRLTKKRVFKIAPLHHHFQFLGWPENKIIVRFWIIAALCAMFTLVTLKIR
jgi:phospho-N-acetylmuramoyl-pentapeptide-transferase